MEGYLEGWHDFNVALMGAVAALAGLLIVASSVNIAEIVKAPAVASRLAAGLAGLVLAIVACALGLIPGIPPLAYGAGVILAAVGAAIIQWRATQRIYGNADPANRWKAGKAALGFVSPLAYLAGGVLLVVGMPSGLVAFAIGAIASIVAGILISWIALVEILR
ncbi:hypothetical protein GCM10009775_33450 [Microbacterium aoyamense]|uniref:Modulator of FtsH protease n=1 Tax=Microbacterium aoyamense TaxID=344166 RepID=A0ABP5BC51_9MICO|nr:hypothetical protein [Microbacterium aoyamense]